jgi:hypothetical protein
MDEDKRHRCTAGALSAATPLVISYDWLHSELMGAANCCEFMATTGGLAASAASALRLLRWWGGQPQPAPTFIQNGEDSEYRCKACVGYFEMFHALLTEDGESSPLESRNFQSTTG